MWRDHCIRGILSHPPGSHRVYLLDALRVEAVKQLAQKLKQSDDTMAQQRISREYSEHHHGAAEAAANPSNNIEKEDEEDDAQKESSRLDRLPPRVTSTIQYPN